MKTFTCATALPMAVLLLTPSATTAFDIAQYTSSKCTGSAWYEKGFTAEKGCFTSRPDGFGGLLNRWSDPADNDLVLALYSDKNCCHANLVQLVNWDDGCIEILSDTVSSYRAVDPENPDEGGGYDTCETELVDDEPLFMEGTPVTWE